MKPHLVSLPSYLASSPAGEGTGVRPDRPGRRYQAKDLVDLWFPIQQVAGPLPERRYAGYDLFGAVMTAQHRGRKPDDGVRRRVMGIHPLQPHVLGLRLPIAEIEWALALRGQLLAVGPARVKVDPSVVTLAALVPAPVLSGWCTVHAEWVGGWPWLPTGPDWPACKARARERLAIDLQHLGVRGDLVLGRGEEMQIQQDIRLMWPVMVHGLSERDSLLLQARGLGSRQRMGCGVLVPADPPGAERSADSWGWEGEGEPERARRPDRDRWNVSGSPSSAPGPRRPSRY